MPMINFKFTQCKLSQTLTFLMIFFYFLGSSLAKAEVIFAETPSVTPPPLETPSVTPPPLETPSVTSPPKSTLDKMDRENQPTNPRPLGCKLRTVCPKEKQLGCRTYLECPKK